MAYLQTRLDHIHSPPLRCLREPLRSFVWYYTQKMHLVPKHCSKERSNWCGKERLRGISQASLSFLISFRFWGSDLMMLVPGCDNYQSRCLKVLQLERRRMFLPLLCFVLCVSVVCCERRTPHSRLKMFGRLNSKRYFLNILSHAGCRLKLQAVPAGVSINQIDRCHTCGWIGGGTLWYIFILYRLLSGSHWTKNWSF